MDKTDYILHMCNDYLYHIEQGIISQYDHPEYFYSYLIYNDINNVCYERKLSNKTIKDYIEQIYKKTNEITEYSLDEKNYELSDAYGGNSTMNGFIGSLYYLQQLKSKLNF